MTLASWARAIQACGVDVRRNEPLAAHTTFRVGGPADAYCEPLSADGLIDAVRLCRQSEIPLFVLGAGSNVLFSDAGWRGVVLATRRMRGITVTDAGLSASAGEPLSRLIAAAENRGSQSLGFLVGIPGSVGGSLATNAGIPGRSLGDVVRRVLVLDEGGQTLTLSPDACAFGYRTSSIRARRLVVLSADFTFDDRVYDADALLARRSATQPIGEASAGCVFRNPPGESAGALIDACGLKGLAQGHAQVSEKHANFIVNTGGATSAEICKLIDIVRQKVYKTYQVSLDLEVEVVNG
ncbi:MAG: UDP-N-acetylmuramate dehydrogenase [Candidatus Bipolaricaulia bacterium]